MFESFVSFTTRGLKHLLKACFSTSRGALRRGGSLVATSSPPKVASLAAKKCCFFIKGKVAMLKYAKRFII